MLMTNDEGSKRKVSLENQIKAKNNNLQLINFVKQKSF